MLPRPETPQLGLASSKQTADEIFKLYGAPGSDGFDVVLECTGVESCMQVAIHVSLNHSFLSLPKRVSLLTYFFDDVDC